MTKLIEAKVLIQEALLLALAWKQTSSEPLARLFTNEYTAISKKLNAAEPRDQELAAQFQKEYQSFSARLPRGQ